MNKLRKKIFWTLFIILSLFLISILLIFNYQNYSQEKKNIEQNLLRMDISFDKNPQNKNEIPKLDDEKETSQIKEESQKKFMDATIYTILLDENDEISEILSHREDGLIDEEVAKQAEKILSDNEQDKTFLGILYLNDFAYKYEAKNRIILIDTHEIRERLTSSLEMAIILFMFGEFIITIVSRILSNWIIKPVEASFNKQKQFIADASHELKTPLSVIMASAETLKENPKEKKWLDTIESESVRMSKLIVSLLDLAKTEHEINQKNLEEVDLSKLIEKSTLSFESIAFEKNIKLDYEIECNIHFKCDTEEIKELLSIMLDNAVKHSPQKGLIKVNLRTEKDNIVLEVINRGKPIPKDEEEKIFERFYRVDKSRNRDENRYGLGLAIAKNIVLNHHGQISASSKNNFTTFKVIFKK